MTAPIRGLALPGINLADYKIENIGRAMTPALAIFPAIVDSNIATTIRLLGGVANRWRQHIKTAKLGFIMKRLIERGILNFKCSTSLELSTACEAGVADVIVAYPTVGANARRVRELAERYPHVNVSSLIESREH